MPRYCLLGRVDPSRLDEYREAHRAVWPELLEACATPAGATIHSSCMMMAC
jgi:L-rhamnose mutarotase